MSDNLMRLTAALAGRYRVERELGEGGMATVYLADDLKHGRQVALKVLKPELAAVVGAERFLAEIRTTANLQHPHILPLHDSGEADGFLYYVMPYIEGETLGDRLEREKQLPVDEAVRIASDVAEALHAAHEQGVIHRDIKPANILLSSGRPLVADFGIALAVSAAGGRRLTETGPSIGTPYYMSPEQASADREPSAASDVYSLGCVLYEMLVGEPPYVGGSVQAILARILTDDAPAPTEVRASIPAHVDATIRKALEKLPADRFGSAQDFAKTLADPAFRHGEGVAGVAAGVGPWKQISVVLGTLLVVASAVAGWGWLRRPGSPDPGVSMRAAVPGLDLSMPGSGRRLAISPDGRWIVAGHREDGLGRALYIREAAALDWRRLPNTENGTNPRFSPDGQWVVFNAGTSFAGTIFKVPIAGGLALPIATGAAAHWGQDDVIVYRRAGRAIYRVGASGDEPELLFDSDTIAALTPYLLPNGRAVVFGTVTGGDPLTGRIMLLEIETGDVRELVSSGNDPRYVSTGHLVYGHGDQALMGVPFDLETLETTGSPVTLVSGLAVHDGGASQFDVSATGTLVYGVSADSVVESPLEWVDMEGSRTPVPIEATTARVPDISPDGRFIAYEAGGNIWIHDVAAGTDRQFTFEGRNDFPVWTRDGRWIYFLSERPGTNGLDGFRRAVDGSSDAVRLWRADGEVALTSVSPDGRWLVLEVRGEGEGGGRDIALFDLTTDSTGVPTRYLQTAASEGEGAISPDGRWMAYWLGDLEAVFVRDFPEPRGRWRVSEAGGGRNSEPVWAPDGSTLYHFGKGGLNRTEVTIDSTFAVGRTSFLFPIDIPGGAGLPWDLHPDGDQFVVAGSVDSDRLSAVHVVTNWFEDLRTRMAN